MKNINLKELFKNKSVIYLSVVLGLLLVIGVSYAYFSITVNGNEEAQDIKVTTGNLSLFYNSGPELKVDNIEPGKILIKEFTVTNTGDFDTEFDINMVDMINTIEKDELVYTLDCVSYEKYGQEGQTEIGTCDGQGTTPFIYSEVPTLQKLKGNNPIKVGVTNKYKLTITFVETGSVQNYNQGKKFIGKIQINEYNFNDSNVPVINNAKIDNLLLTALLKDTNGLSAYAVTSAGAEEPSSWKNVSKNEYTVSDRVDDYDKKLWVKNIDGNIVYKDLTPISNLTIDPAGGTYNGSTGSITTSERYKTEIELSDPTREGYTFNGWNVTGERSTLKDSSTAMLINKVRMMSTRLAEGNSGNKTLVMGIEETKVTATWRQNNYDLTINPNGGSYNGSTETKTSSVTYGTDVDISDPIRAGYTFTGWTVSSDKASLNGKKLTMGLEDCTLTANWAINSYPWIAYHNKMNVNGNGYTLVSADTKEGTADFGTKVTPTVNTYTGFTSPASKTITIVVDTKPSTKNVVNYNYDRNKYTLTINPNGGTYNGSTSSTTTSEYFEAVKAIKSPTKTGYTFKNWSKTGNSTLVDTTLTMGSENTTLTANYEANKYTVSFNANSGSVDTKSKEVTYNGTYGELPTATRDGYVFLGWFTDASSGAQIKEDSPVTITANQTLYAHWKANTYPWVAYHKKMKVDGSTYTLVSADTEEGEADYLSKVTPFVKTYTGFTSPSTKTITIAIDSDKPSTKNVVTYNYTRNKYTLTINPNGGTYNGSTSNTVSNEYYEATKTISKPTKTGYTFSNWTKSGNATLSGTTLTMGSGSTTLTANYTANKYTVNFNANGGSVTPSSMTVTFGAKYGTLPTPTKPGHEFIGWFTSATSGTQIKASSTVSITTTQTLYAHWKQNVTLAQYLINNYSTLGLTKISQSATGNQNYATTEYRYQGKTPNNYITFNGETGVWRIIGVFEVQTPNGNGYTKEYKVKLVRNQISEFSWDHKGLDDTVNKSDWTTATLMTMLNSGPYYNRTSGYTQLACSTGQGTTISSTAICDYSSNGLTSEAKNQISSTKWYLGTVGGNSQLQYDNTKKIYAMERGTSVESGNSQSWDGKVGLIYTSDYMYASSACYNNDSILGYKFFGSEEDYSSDTCKNTNWLFTGNDYFTLPPGSSSGVMSVTASGIIISTSVSADRGILPSVYLSSNVIYNTGNGSASNPFVIQ